MSKSAVPRAYATAKRSYKPAQTAEPGFTLHKLRPDDYHEICGLTERVKTILPDADRCPRSDLRAGDKIATFDAKYGVITGFAIDTDLRQASPFARVNGRLYHVSTLKRA